MKSNELSCGTCKKVLQKSLFYKSSTTKRGYDAKCKACSKTYSANRRVKRPEMVLALESASNRRRWEKVKGSPEHRAKKSARDKIGTEIRAGRLTREPCQVCGTTTDVHGHHEDHNEQLDVQWLCRKHHQIEDDRLKALKSRVALV